MRHPSLPQKSPLRVFFDNTSLASTKLARAEAQHTNLCRSCCAMSVLA